MNQVFYKYEWLIVYLVYNNSFYDLNELNTGKGILSSDYFTMQSQTNYLFNLIEQLSESDKVKILIVNLDYDYQEGKIEFKIIEKVGLKLVVKNKLLPSINGLSSEESISHVLNTVKQLYNYCKIAITTFGHGSLFGINLISQKLQDDIRKNENNIDFKSIKEFNDYVLKNNDLFKTSIIYDNIYKESLIKFVKFIVLKTKASNTTKIIKSYISITKKIKNKFNFDYSLHRERSIISELTKKIEKFLIQFFNSDNDMLDEILKINILTNREFSDGIKKSSMGKVNILIMYNCLMQNIYTQYEFKDTVEYLVAPVGGIGFPGYDYEGVYDELLKNTAISPEKLGSLYINSFETGILQNMEPFKENFKNRLFVSCEKIQSDRLISLKSAYNKWLIEYEKVSKEKDYYDLEIKGTVIVRNELIAIVSNSISQCFNVSSKCLTVLSVVDFYVFLKTFLYKLKDTDTLIRNKKDLISITSDIINLFKDFQNKSNQQNSFYNNSNKVEFQDNNYRKNESSKLAKGIILNNYSNEKLAFLETFFGLNSNVPKTIIPSFLENSKTGELLLEI